MKGMRITLLCIAASLIIAGTAFAQFPQHFAKETPLPLWTWTINWGGILIPIPMIFPNIIANPELPPITIGPDTFYGVVSGNRVRWYFQGPIRKPISDLLICVKGKVFKEQFPQDDGYVAQTGRIPNGAINMADQPRIAAWALPFDYQNAQPFGPVPRPEIGSWTPYYLSARILPGLGVDIVLGRTAPPPPPAIPGGVGLNRITLIDGFQICLLIRLPITGTPTTADWDGDALNPLFALIQNDAGLESEVTLAAGDLIAVQIDILDGHLHNIYLSPTGSVVVKYITPLP
jgi:hypothetical protein